MENGLLWIGRAAGVLGVLLCVIAGVARLAGAYWLGSFQLGTLLQAGTAGMVVACLCFLVVLTERAKVGH